MKPFLSEIKLKARLSARVLRVALGFDGFPSSHAHLNRGHPGLCKNAFDGVLVSEVLFASFGPDVVQDEASEDVQWLSWVGESADMVSELPWRVVIFFQHRFPKEDEGPIDVQLPNCPRLFCKHPKLRAPCGIRRGSVAEIPPRCTRRFCIEGGFPLVGATFPQVILD
ncbi:unnamed protein product [Sphagnum troendelagicum]|uniref:Uncharacterized protein n=1 Tax=Sphagnum troendelagicum TaxID=128251 RepID=A0ABP0UMF5_9BRYO